nr:DUF411 domain-containing protein [Caldimonas brevitalea]
MAGAALGLTASVYAKPTPTAIEVWKSPECGCCKGWIAHLEKNGFVAIVHNEGNTDARKALGLPLQFGSCHTAKVGGYAIEGHVPAREIRRLLQERPKAVGLAVPAMPLGSPGMDGPDFDHQTQPYDVLLVLQDGSTRVYQSYFR